MPVILRSYRLDQAGEHPSRQFPSSGPAILRRKNGPMLWKSGSRTLSMVLVPATLVAVKRLVLIVTYITCFLQRLHFLAQRNFNSCEKRSERKKLYNCPIVKLIHFRGTSLPFRKFIFCDFCHLWRLHSAGATDIRRSDKLVTKNSSFD